MHREWEDRVLCKRGSTRATVVDRASGYMETGKLRSTRAIRETLEEPARVEIVSSTRSTLPHINQLSSVRARPDPRHCLAGLEVGSAPIRDSWSNRFRFHPQRVTNTTTLIQGGIKFPTVTIGRSEKRVISAVGSQRHQSRMRTEKGRVS